MDKKTQCEYSNKLSQRRLTQVGINYNVPQWHAVERDSREQFKNKTLNEENLLVSVVPVNQLQLITTKG